MSTEPLDASVLNFGLLLVVVLVLFAIVFWMGYMRLQMLELKASLLSFILTISIKMNGGGRRAELQQDEKKEPPDPQSGGSSPPGRVGG